MKDPFRHTNIHTIMKYPTWPDGSDRWEIEEWFDDVDDEFFLLQQQEDFITEEEMNIE